MEETNTKSINFFSRVYKAITNFDFYSNFAEEPLSKAITYLTTLVLIVSIVITAVYIIAFHSELTNGIEYLNENVENMSFVDSTLSYNNDEYTIYDGEENTIPIVVVDTSDNPDLDTYKEKVSLYDFGFIVLKDRLLVYMASDTDEGFQEVAYAGYDIEDMDKEEILDLLGSTNIYAYIAVAMFITEFVQYFIYILINAVVLAVIGQILALILHLKIKFSGAYKMGIYALTLPTLLELLYIIINSTTGFVVPYFNWMYTTISYIYICVAILMIKTDFINTQRELMRIKIEEQKNKEENNEEQNQEDTDVEDETKEDDNETKEDKLKEQTDG